MKAKKIFRRILIGIGAVLLAVLLILQIGVTVVYWDFFTDSKFAFRVPGQWDGFVPQGFHYMEETDTYLTSGYMKDHSASRIYVRKGDDKTFWATLHNPDQTDYDLHAGGVCVNGEFVYLPGDTGVDVFKLEDVLAGKATLQGTIPMGFRVDFCSFENGYLMVGNFYYEGHYDTPENHKVKTPAGDANPAVITVFRADDQQEFAIDPNAVAAFSIRQKVQGMCLIGEDEIVLSTSWSINSSELFHYRVDTDRVGKLETLTGEVPLYYLDSANLIRTVTAPPMAEELVYKDGRVLVMNESACTKYIFGKFIRGGWVYAYEAE